MSAENYKNIKELQIKEAQQYGIGHQFKQYLTPSGWSRAVTERLSPQYKDRMEKLRIADEQMRAIFMGSQQAGLINPIDLRDAVKQAKKSFKEGRYLDVAHWVSRVSDGIFQMLNVGKEVVDLRDEELAEYYTRIQDANIDENYFDTNPNDGKPIEVTASITDFLGGLLGSNLEKVYWRRVRTRKLGVQSLVKQTEAIVDFIMSALNRMGSFRAQGKISEWLSEYERIINEYKKFYNGFKTIYDSHIADLANLIKDQHQKIYEEQYSPKPMEQPSNVTQEMTEEKLIPVEQKVKMDVQEPAQQPSVPTVELKSPVQEERHEPGRPRKGDKRKQFDQMEQLLQALKNKPTESKEQEVKTPQTFKTPETPATYTSEQKVDLKSNQYAQEEPEQDEELHSEIDVEDEVEPTEESEGFEEEETDEEKDEEDKNILFIVLPRKGIDNLEQAQNDLEDHFEKKIMFVTRDSGRETVKEYQDEGYEIDIKPFEEVKNLIISEADPQERMLAYLDNPQFLEKLITDPSLRNSIGDFRMPMIFDLPQFQGINKETREEIVNKLNKIREEEKQFESESEPPEGQTSEDDIMTEEEEQEEIFIHVNKLEELTGKILKELGDSEIFNLLNNKDYLNILPRNEDGNFNLDLISKFPEVKGLGKGSKFFLSTLKSLNKKSNVENLLIKVSHKKFFNELNKVSKTGNVGLMAAMMCKYSEKIENIDPKTSIELIKSAQELLNV